MAAAKRKPDQVMNQMQPEGSVKGSRPGPDLELLKQAALNSATELDIKDAHYEKNPNGGQDIMVAELKDGTVIKSM